MMTRAARILYIIGQLRRGGAEQQLYYLLKYLRPAGAVVSLESQHQNTYWDSPIRELGYTVYEIPRRRSADLRRLLEVIRIIKQEQPDLVHLFTDTPSGIYGRLASIWTGTRCIVGERRHPSADPRWYEWLKAYWLNRHVEAIVTNAHSSLQYLLDRQAVRPTKAFYIPNGIELDRFSPMADARVVLPDKWRDKVVVTMVASLLPKKAPEVFIQVAKQVVKQHPFTCFMYIGMGPLLSKTKVLAQELGLEDYIWFTGQRLDVPTLLHASDIFLLTSKNEGTPNVIMEAMAAGLPCIATDSGDTRFLIQDGTTGFIAPIGAVDALAARVGELVADPSMRYKMGEAGKRLIQEYNVYANAVRYDELYSEVLDSVDRRRV